ncbi:hypothetical protein HPP92_016913 [Vanilla planifolia]|uniref:Uncharacterized protein n=1 Tax=Vanilla planifolia TaxID=51239 RepID=A0A835QP48_VANPL|nr:hypothetical protein HPP92_016913 [Vanilla planifolia]
MPGSAAAPPGWFNWQGMCLTAFDSDIRRRPYHRNCGCALHRSRAIPADLPCPSSSSVSYPIRHVSIYAIRDGNDQKEAFLHD